MKNAEFTLLFEVCYDAFLPSRCDLPSTSLMSFLLRDAFRARNKSLLECASAKQTKKRKKNSRKHEYENNEKTMQYLCKFGREIMKRQSVKMS